MKAIILCCDKYHQFGLHTIKCYNELWKNHPFEFYLPYNTTKPNFENINLIQTPVSFKETIRELTKNINDEEWIYWCSSDTYPIKLDIQKYENILNNLDEISKKDCNVVFPGPWKNRIKVLHMETYNFEVNGIKYYSTNCLENGTNVNLWLHQFMKCKVLKKLFECFKEPNVAKNLDRQLYHKNFPFYDYLRKTNFCLTDSSCGTFGENTSRGLICPNALENMKRMDIDIPKDFQIRTHKLIWN